MFSKVSLAAISAILFCGAISFAADSPINRFAKVDDGVYRGAVISTDEQVAYLKSVGVRSIVSMITDPAVHQVEQQLADKYGIKLVWVAVDGWNGPTDPQTAQIQKALNDPNGRPVYIHCTHGRDRTGVEIGLYRVWTNKWTAHVAYDEMKKMGFRTIIWPMNNYYKSRSGYEKEEGDD